MKKINRIISLFIIVAMIFSFNYSYAMNIVKSDNSNAKYRVVLTTDVSNIKKGETAIIHVAVENNTVGNGICEISFGVSRSNAFNGGSIKAGDDWNTDKWGSGFDEIKMSTKNKKMITSNTHVADIGLQASENSRYTSYTISLYNIVISDGEHTTKLEDTSITFNIVDEEASEKCTVNLIAKSNNLKRGSVEKLVLEISQDLENTIQLEDYIVTGEIITNRNKADFQWADTLNDSWYITVGARTK